MSISAGLITLELSEFPVNNYVKIDPLHYEGAKFTLREATFSIFARKQNGIGIDRFYEGVKLAWPKWLSYFPLKTRPITIIETDWGLGGGSLGSFVLAVHLREKYDAESSAYLESVLGWPAQSTGTAYVEKQFASFDDPMQAYVTDQIVHELGHIFFLHGITELNNENNLWFGLGLGLVYDRLIWKEISEIPSPVFEAFDWIWKGRFANNTEIDQRLINPNTEKDKDFGLVRLQTYGHAKACAYLSELRIRIGANRFDDYVRSYLSKPIGAPIEYQDFLSLFSNADLAIVRKTESDFVIR
jgi:hypothetical protein